MRRVFCTVLLIAAIAGCSSHSASDTNATSGPSSGPGGSQTQTMQVGGSSINMGKNAIDPARLGLPIYPSAAGNVTGAMASTGAYGLNAMVALKTSDSFDKVYAWYKSHMPANAQVTRSTSGSTLIATFVEGTSKDKEVKSVTLVSFPQGATITLRSRAQH